MSIGMSLVFIGIILNVIIVINPEFSKRFPTIYGWFDGWLQLEEFALKSVLGGFYSLFTGNWHNFWIECREVINMLIKQFITWLSTLSF